MRKLFYVLAVAVLTPIGLAAAALALWWFTTTNTASVNFRNRSGRPLHNLLITAPGRSVRFTDIAPDGDCGFASSPRLTYGVRVSFDADGQHYEFPARTYMLPFGDTIVSLSLDDRLTLSIAANPTFTYR